MPSHELEGIDLTSVNAKLARADEHLKTITGDIAAFMHLHTHMFVLDDNAQALQRFVYVQFGAEPDLVTWSLTFGDFVHCLRSALDHLIYAIAIHESKADPPGAKKLMMPLKTTTQGFADAFFRIEKLSCPVRTRIESVAAVPRNQQRSARPAR